MLGVILMFGGLELAASVTSEEFSHADRAILATTAGLALWNMGAAYLTGLLLYHAATRGIIRL